LPNIIVSFFVINLTAISKTVRVHFPLSVAIFSPFRTPQFFFRNVVHVGNN